MATRPPPKNTYGKAKGKAKAKTPSEDSEESDSSGSQPARLDGWARDLAAIRRDLGAGNSAIEAEEVEPEVEEEDDLLAGGEEGEQATNLLQENDLLQEQASSPSAAPSRQARGRGRVARAASVPTRARSERIAEAQRPREPAPAPETATSRSKSPNKTSRVRARQPTTPSGPARPAAKRGRRLSTGATPGRPTQQQQPASINAIDVDAAMDAAEAPNQAAMTTVPLPKTPSILQRPRRVSFNIDPTEQSSPYNQHFPQIPPSPEIRMGYAPRAPAGATTRDYANYNPQTAKYSLTHDELQAMLTEAAQSAAANKMAELTRNASSSSRGKQKFFSCESGGREHSQQACNYKLAAGRRARPQCRPIARRPQRRSHSMQAVAPGHSAAHPARRPQRQATEPTSTQLQHTKAAR
jgi:hypothetical protein